MAIDVRLLVIKIISRVKNSLYAPLSSFVFTNNLERISVLWNSEGLYNGVPDVNLVGTMRDKYNAMFHHPDPVATFWLQ